MKNSFSWFRKVGKAEGISFLILLLIAMPLKYLAGQPLAVTVFGSIHGILFISFMVLAYMVKEEQHKNFGWLFKAFLASVLPLGTFIMDRQWKKEEAISLAGLKS